MRAKPKNQRSDLIDKFLIYLHEKEFSEKTIKLYHSQVCLFSEMIALIYDPSGRTKIDNLLLKIDRYRLASFLAEIQRQGYSKRSIAYRISVIRCFYNFLIELGLTKENPAKFSQSRRKNKMDLSQLIETCHIQKDDVISKWLIYNQRLLPRTQAHYEMVISKFAAYMPFELRDLGVKHIDRYIDSILQKHCNRTANAHLTAIKSFCRWLYEHFNLPNPAVNIRMLKEDPPDARYLTSEEYHKVLSVCDNSQADVIQFIANTGLRLTETRNLTWGNISPDMKYISLTGKGRKHRLIYLNQVCRDILNKHKKKTKSNEIEFLQNYKKRWELYNLCTRLASRADMPKFGPHALRHFFATRLMQKGVPIAKISRCLGHSETRTTEKIYIHWLPEDIDGLTDILDE